MVEFSRRTFIKGTVLGGTAFSALGFDLTPLHAQTQGLKISRASETRSTCPYCAVSCGVIIYTLGDKAKNAIPQVVHVEGDPDHPINRGTLCPKGSSLEQDILNERRILKPQVRRPGGHRLGRHFLGSGLRRNRALGEEDARRTPSSNRTRKARPSTAAKASPSSAAAPTRTNSIISPSKVCAAWGSATWKTRPAFDTAQRSPVWGPPSDAAQ